MNVEIDLLGGFAVRVDGRPVPAGEWRRRQAASLVKLLALAPRRTLHREQVIDALWPHMSIYDAGPPRTSPAVHSATRGRWFCQGTPFRSFPTPMLQWTQKSLSTAPRRLSLPSTAIRAD